MAEIEYDSFIGQWWDAQNAMDKKYGQPVVGATEDLRKAFIKQMMEVYDAGHSAGLAEAHKIARDVVGETIQVELKKNPKMSLKTYAKHYGYLEESE